MKLVLDASPIIVLAKSGLIDRLLSMAEGILIPRAVANEIAAAADPLDAARLWIASYGSPHGSPKNGPIPALIAGWDLGAGESAVLQSANSNPGSTAVLDDLAARRCAATIGLPVIGTIGLILLSKKRGILADIEGALAAVVDAGLYIAPRHLVDVIEAAKEF